MKKYFVAESDTDLDNGFTVYSKFEAGSQLFWDDVQEQLANEGVMCRIAKAIEVNDDCDWVGKDICFR